MKFTDFNLHENLIKAVDATGFTTPTEIQQQAITPVMEGHDIMASAQTGTGKTAAFVLPTLHKILTQAPVSGGKGPRAIILSPTRELAMQIMDNIRTFTKGSKIFSGVVVGGASYGPQINMLRKPVDILVATPGRLIDHMQENRVDFSRVECMVLDEADRMLDMGFLQPVQSITQRIPNEHQTLLFSATFNKEIEKIAQQILKEPVRIQLAHAQSKHENITQSAYRADGGAHKHNMLSHFLEGNDVWQAIVFTRTKRAADKLAERLKEEGHETAALHGDMRQSARRRTIDLMHKNRIRVLVATDVAARGIDVKQLSHVFNYDMPMEAEDYTHRIGRTGRGGESGTAISFVGPQDIPQLRAVEQMLGKSLNPTNLEGYESELSDAEFDGMANAGGKKGRGRNGGGRNRNAGKPRTFSKSRGADRGERSERRRDFGDRNDNRGNRNAGGRNERNDNRSSRDFGGRNERSDNRGNRDFGGRNERNDNRGNRDFGGRNERSDNRGNRDFGGRNERNDNRGNRDFGGRNERNDSNANRRSRSDYSSRNDQGKRSFGGRNDSQRSEGGFNRKASSSDFGNTTITITSLNGKNEGGNSRGRRNDSRGNSNGRGFSNGGRSNGNNRGGNSSFAGKGRNGGGNHRGARS